MKKGGNNTEATSIRRDKSEDRNPGGVAYCLVIEKCRVELGMRNV